MTKQQFCYIVAFLAQAYLTGKPSRGVDGPDGRKDIDDDFDPRASSDIFTINFSTPARVTANKNGNYGDAIIEGQSIRIELNFSGDKLIQAEAPGFDMYKINISGRRVTINDFDYEVY